ncbi:MAG: replicative DNA helicase [Bdellovibrionales bacterium]|nr:replicative DNA helicase [Bdellovibrionales bacterium]
MSNNSNHSTRIPPQAIEAEKSVLGGVLLDNDAINVAAEFLQAEDFYNGAHRNIFDAMLALYNRREPIDVITLSEQLKAMGSLEAVGGVDSISSLASLVPSAANVPYYVKVIKDKSLRRKLIHEASSLINEAFADTDDLDTFLDSAEQRILSVSDNRTGGNFAKVGDIVQDTIKVVEQLYDQKEIVTGVPSGFKELDKKTAGFQPSDLIIVAARPSMGKTSLAMSMTQNAAIGYSRPAAIFSLEMSKEQLVLRMLCSEARVGNSKVRTGHLGERDFPSLVDAASKIADAPVYIDDTPALTITELRAKARRLHNEVGLGMIVVDYLQLLRSPMYAKSREQEISDISRSLKALAKELNIPVIALSQLNRSVEQREDKRPKMSDLRESGAIEQDADVIMFIYRDEVYNELSEDKGTAEIIIGKQRNGPTGTTKLAFLADYTRFENLEQQHPDEMGFMEGDISPALGADDFF